jgi:16S rRNA C967 or C1407 C5-methylase (RsmB/RsmF family)/NOL1/NOP2/fmu family ribosome biogenesis protein
MTRELPAPFSNRMQQLLQKEFNDYIAAIGAEAPVSLRVNPKKINTELSYPKVAWCVDGYYLPTRPVFTFDPLFQAGSYYVQEAASMFTGYALQQINPQNNAIKVLDLCAAPGGKSTQIVSSISQDSLLVANEVIKSRVGVLRENLEKWGYPNTIVTNNDPKDFEALEGFFDVVVCDAPCSGEGLFRKEPESMNEWSEANVQLCSHRQQRILVSAIKALKEGGHLIYSTCTHAPEENEQNVEWMCDEFGLEEVKLTLPEGAGITEAEAGYRFYPHLTKAEGFYCAVLQKKGDGETKLSRTKKPLFIAARKIGAELSKYYNTETPLAFYERNAMWYGFPARYDEELNLLAEKLYIVSFGTETGELMKGELLPAQGLANSIIHNKEMFTSYELEITEAVKYLRKDTIIDNSGTRGWKLATFHGIGLGFFKNLGNRTNNYFPKERRILKTPAQEEVFSLIR